MTHRLVSLVLPFLIAGCASYQGDNGQASIARPVTPDTTVPLFSSRAPHGLPEGWKPLIILRTKKPTQYQLVSKEGKTVLHARADSASSALMHDLDVDPARRPWLQWQWQIPALLKTADNTKRTTEDSPVRIVLGFDGDKDSLPFTDQVLFETAKVVTGHDFPYATLMYIWENNLPVGTIIRSTYSSRIKMMVAESGSTGLGEWRVFSRNIIEDYEKAFGEKPGRLIGIGVLTDTDNTGESAEAWYGDIRLSRTPVLATAIDRPVNASLPLFPSP
ncbi:MAG TPA: DUF3047 domain-containing protein [Noviherbaspirillum sp.]|uniref:DUF3047 domain-containing protein n=1 Tax=Noviherbaspirillum sp. TaxID=1926288 RepID=UPI002B481974|nr:DUF3047 domain-containing protein [Noviherbaspirillum sp.]HJV84861.1 DUF3047 domain-containing protein [Noviherbaspirillum sp.]